MLEFYTNPMSRGQIIRWALEEVGQPYEEHIISYGAEMKSEPYISINPMGKVPAIRHDGQVLTECPAIISYLAETFPDAGLLPEPTERADYLRWFFYTAGPFEQAVTSKSLGWEPSTEQSAMAGFGSYELVMKVVDDLLSSRDYVCGDRFTAVDVYLGSQILFGLNFGSVPKLASFQAYAGRMAARPASQKAKARDDELLAAQQATNG
ncbi:MAG: glutathione S-transferase family protein [Pseudomonadota bacterium]